MRRILPAALLLAVAACAEPPPIVTLAPSDPTPLKAAFNAHPERTRVVALLSPT